ncbi:MAG TPA: A/G-specific adenine glycosylase [Flavobacteriales bacterium]|nr:A/G-specific adenine glycosylase [Flavobacteriales bacterium]
MNFTQQIINWYEANKRDLPWRHTDDPYKIWLSEIILQQTRVNQGTAYYLRFVELFPTIKHLAEATEKQVLKVWQGLGYYSRARNLHKTAHHIHFHLNGVFPQTFESIRELFGVGDYTAAAISSIVYHEAHAVVDGNVYRLLSRYFGVDAAIDTSIGKRKFASLANSIIDVNRPGVFNQAMMEFGAIQCKPQNPDCSICPVMSACVGYRENRVSEYPVKSKTVNQRNRFFNFLVIHGSDGMYIRKRTDKDIWKNLYEPPMIESDNAIDFSELIKTVEWKRFFNGVEYVADENPLLLNHALTHQQIQAQFWSIQVKGVINPASLNNCFTVSEIVIDDYPIHRLFEKFLEKTSLFRFELLIWIVIFEHNLI